MNMDDFFVKPSGAPPVPEVKKVEAIPARKWPVKHWPVEARPVEGLHPSIKAYRYGPTYLVQVSYECKEVVERCRAQIEDRLGVAVAPVRNVCYKMDDGTEQWWCVVVQELLLEMDAMSWPTSVADMVGPSGTQLKVSERRARLTQLFSDTMTALEAVIREERDLITGGDYIPMTSENPADVAKIYKAQAVAVKTTKQSLTEILANEPEKP